MALSHGLCFGSRQLTTLTPSPPSLMRRLCLPSHLLTSLEICQLLALSQMRSRTFLPIASSFSKLHSTNRVVGGYRAYRPPIDEAHPRLIYSRQVESVAAYGLRLGVFLCDRTLDEAKRLSVGAPGTQGRQGHPAPPAFVLEAGGPLGIGIGDFHQPVAPPFFRSYKGSGEVIHSLARIHRTPSTRDKVARMVSPETCSSVRPRSEAASAAISKVLQRLDSYPNSLGERWSISLKASALFRSNASRVFLGREDFASRASRPLSLKSWMASRTVCEAHPRFKAILGARSPLELAKSICERRMVKVSVERSPFWRLSRSSSDNERTKIGVFMNVTVTRQPKPILKMH